MRRHHVQLAWEGISTLSARCRCGWAGARYIGDGAWWAAERDARAHEQAVRAGRWRNRRRTPPESISPEPEQEDQR